MPMTVASVSEGACHQEVDFAQHLPGPGAGAEAVHTGERNSVNQLYAYMHPLPLGSLPPTAPPTLLFS